MIELTKCPSCDSSNIKPYISCVDYTMSEEKFTIVSCETCDFKFTSPRPEDEKLGDYYKSDNYISHTNNKIGLFNKLYHFARKISINIKLRLIKAEASGKKILDIGSGTGEFLKASESLGYTGIGIEPSKIARKKARKNYNLNISKNTSLNQFKTSEFDVITMWHVLEHVTDLNNTIKGLHKIIKKDGKLIIGVPNHNSYDAKFYGKYWAAWDVPIHLWHFTKKSMEEIMKKHDFKLVYTKSMIFDSFYISLLSEEYKNGTKKFIKGLMVGLISNIFGIFTTKGHSSIIYIFKPLK
jgi:2-polyprenyl-3-methyl-5-hydroxy-6-metoxy-1,4-benzoquinol methylase